MRVFKGHGHNVPCCDVSPCGSFLASVSVDASAIIWNARTGEKLSQISLPGGWYAVVSGIGWTFQFLIDLFMCLWTCRGWSCKWIKKSDVGIFMPPDSLSSMFGVLSGSKQPELDELIKFAQSKSDDSRKSAQSESEPTGAPTNTQDVRRDHIRFEYLNHSFSSPFGDCCSSSYFTTAKKLRTITWTMRKRILITTKISFFHPIINMILIAMSPTRPATPTGVFLSSVALKRHLLKLLFWDLRRRNERNSPKAHPWTQKILHLHHSVTMLSPALHSTI